MAQGQKQGVMLVILLPTSYLENMRYSYCQSVTVPDSLTDIHAYRELGKNKVTSRVCHYAQCQGSTEGLGTAPPWVRGTAVYNSGASPRQETLPQLQALHLINGCMTPSGT